MELLILGKASMRDTCQCGVASQPCSPNLSDRSGSGYPRSLLCIKDANARIGRARVMYR